MVSDAARLPLFLPEPYVALEIYFPESEEIYFKKTREYFKEVVSSYSNENYRSAIVMLYSISILGKESELYDFFIFYYGDNQSFDMADERFDFVIAPYLDSFIASQLKKLLDYCNGNSQIYGRRTAYSSNTKIAKAILQKLGKDFDFSEYKKFDFDKSILEESEEE